MKKSEARILVFLSQTPREKHYARKMSQRLDMDYNYMLNILASMTSKEWLQRMESPANPTRVFYEFTVLGQEALSQAKTRLAGE